MQLLLLVLLGYLLLRIVVLGIGAAFVFFVMLLVFNAMFGR